MSKPSYYQAILKTLAHAAYYQTPLTKNQLWLRLIWSHSLPPQKKTFNSVLNKLINSKKVKKLKFKNKDYFTLKSSDSLQVLKKRNQPSLKKISLAQKLIQPFLKISWIDFIALTGSLAVLNAKEEDDIDLLVVTQKNRLWITRLIIDLYCYSKGIRRKPGDSKVKNKLCLNLWMDTQGMTVPENLRNLQSAFDLINIRPIYDPKKAQQKIFQKNPWTKKFFPNTPQTPTSSLKKFNQLSVSYKEYSPNYLLLTTYYFRLFVKMSLNILLDIFNITAFLVQYAYMFPKKTRESISIHYAYFHPQSQSILTVKKAIDKIALNSIK